jgi:putative addiction module killer protein
MMIEIRQTDVFSKWLRTLRDIQARARVQARIDRLEAGNPGDVKPVGSGVSEMRIHYGPGYRVYFIERGSELIILLAGGDKTSQTTDIQRAVLLSKELDDGEDQNNEI